MNEIQDPKNITIVNDDGLYTVIQGDRYADKLGSDECLALVAVLINPVKTLGWMRTAAEHQAIEESYLKIKSQPLFEDGQ